MKKIKQIMLTLICIFMLSGCIKENITMSINKDKSMNLDVQMMISEKMFEDDSDKASFTSQAKELESKGYKVTQKSENGYTGFIISKSYPNIDDLSNNNGDKVALGDILDEKFDSSKLFSVKKGLLKNTYTANFQFEFNQNDFSQDDNDDSSFTFNDNEVVTTEAFDSNEDDSSEIASDEDMSALMSLAGEMEFKYVVNLPYKSRSNNATSETNSGKTLTWNLSTQGNSEINFSFDMYNMNIIYICAGAIVLLIIIIIIIIISSKKKKSGKETLIHADYDPSIVGQINETVNETKTPIENNIPQSNTSLEYTMPQNIVTEQTVQNNMENPIISETQEVTNNTPVQEQPSVSNEVPVMNQQNNIQVDVPNGFALSDIQNNNNNNINQ